MNKYQFIYLVWLLPLYFIGMGIYQIAVYQGIHETYENGDGYEAEVIEFEVKQIAAQSNGYVVLQFTTNSGETIREQLALSIQMAQAAMSDDELIPVRYLSDSFRKIVIVSIYEFQQDMIRVNLAVMGIGLLVTTFIAGWASRYATRKIRDGEEILVIERVDETTGAE